ncbi:NACHT domain-containing protein [Serratia fonticola]|uniref:NACHT domain-containing protein n=1 Tax=Serratia fonticola TaxID=47917 RepID=UPI001647CCD8|nr:NACHT domain-containing protein [Serratia fonticola]MBC3229989.1 NACHT domain-containing protein [Serratia fonticola]
MEFDDAKLQLAMALRSLDPAGSLGFEGLLRDILVEVTKLSFGLAKSGPQGGSDVRSLGLNLFEVALEAKRYGEHTTLQVDALKAKLFETSRSENGTDLWILAATRSISATDNEELTLVGEGLGITVLILDWPTEQGQLPDLAVLCAQADAVLNRHLNGIANLSEIVTAIRAHPNFLAAADRLQCRLTAPDIGYAAATEAMKQWMLTGLSNDRNAASRLGGKFNDILDPGCARIPRPGYEAQLDQWLAAGKPAVLLGDEGLGKTWLFLSWWHARINAEADLPLTLFIPAKEVKQGSLSELIAQFLEKRLSHGSVQFWQRRIAQWLKLRKDGPQILLMIDGLNQYWQKKDWADLIQPAFDDHWNHRISILMSCWPDHWNDLQKLATLIPRPTEIRVERFDDSELDALLKEHDLSRENFGSAMLSLMMVPRLSALAIALQQELIASGDITPERLAYEDWKHRIELRGSQLAISDAEFQMFITELGMQLRSSIDNTSLTRHNVIERLGRDSGKDRADLLSTVAELISGQWLVPTGQANQFRVNPTLTPFALGLALVHHLKPTDGSAAANDIIAEHIDPFSGQSLGVEILRAAVTTALLDNSVSRQVRRALFSRWISEQNFSRLDFEAFWRIIGLDVELVLQIVEEIWLGESSGSIVEDEIMIKGLANAYQFEAVAPLIEAKITYWLGLFWTDPLQGTVLGRIDQTSKDSLRRQEVTAANHDAWQKFEGHDAFPAIELCDAGNPSWLSHRVFGIISLLPRARFIEAIAAWSISRAVMGSNSHFDELAWMLRLNRKDSVETRNKILGLVDSLNETGHQLAFNAARWLLEALADPESENKIRQLNTSVGPIRNTSGRRPAIPEDDILNPGVDVDPNKIKEAERIRPADFDADITSSRKLLILARTNPNRLREVVGERVTGADRMAALPLRQLLRQMRDFQTILNDDERNLLEAGIDYVLKENTPEIQKELNWWHARRLDLQLASRSGLVQLEFLLNEARDRRLMGNININLLNFSQDDIRFILGRFEVESDRETVLSWLMLLEEFADSRSIDGWSELPALLCHVDDEIAELAIGLSAYSTNPVVYNIIANSSWTAKSVTNRTQRYNRSVALLNASMALKRPELLDRADKEIMALWLQREPDNPDAIRNYENYIRRAIDELHTPGRSINIEPLINHKFAVATLLDRVDDDFWCWLEQKIKSEIKVTSVDLMAAFPLPVMAEALMNRRPELGLILWDNFKKTMKDDSFKITGMACLPFMALNDTADMARNNALKDVVNDQDIADLLNQIEEHGQTAWLVDKVLELMNSGDTESLAMSVTLLGFADESQRVELAWVEIERRIPLGGWLEDVYRTSRQNFERNRWARHWFNRYLHSTTDSEAIAAHLLLGATIDKRARLWIKRRRLNELKLSLRKYWDLNTDLLNSASKKRRTKLKDSLFWTRTMKQTQWPWL